MVTEETIVFWVKLLFYITAGFFLLWFIARFAVTEFVTRRNSKAPLVTCGATVRTLHPEIAVVPQGRTSGNTFFVTFRLDSGAEVKLHMTYEHFYLLKEGDRGQLTYQGTRFWKFQKED